MLVVTVVVGALTVLGSGVASADRPVPRLTVYSETLGMFGDHDFCRGAVHVGLTTPTTKRGVLRLTLKSYGFIGNGSGWQRNPHCRVLVDAVTTSANNLYKETFIAATFGARPGQLVIRDIYTGSGPVSIGVNPYARDTPIRAPQGQAVGAMVLVP
ncbi:hypothetical protein GCM10022238_24900 [Gordonia hankookensis]